jgi:hypothetical protein
MDDKTTRPKIRPPGYPGNYGVMRCYCRGVFDLAKADLIYQRSYIGSLGNRQFASSEITIGNVSAPFRGDGGRLTPTLGGFSSEIFTKADSQIASTTFVFLDHSSNFTPNGVLAGGSLEFTEISVFARTLDFSVSSETLPPLLSPVFAASAPLVRRRPSGRWELLAMRGRRKA